FQNAGVTGAILEGDHQSLESLRDLLIWEDDRLQNIFASLTRADACQVGADLGTFIAELVTTHARGFRLFEEGHPPFLRIATNQALTEGAQLITRIERSLEFPQLILDGAVAPF